MFSTLQILRQCDCNFLNLIWLNSIWLHLMRGYFLLVQSLIRQWFNNQWLGLQDQPVGIRLLDIQATFSSICRSLFTFWLASWDPRLGLSDPMTKKFWFKAIHTNNVTHGMTSSGFAANNLIVWYTKCTCICFTKQLIWPIANKNMLSFLFSDW